MRAGDAFLHRVMNYLIAKIPDMQYMSYYQNKYLLKRVACHFNFWLSVSNNAQ